MKTMYRGYAILYYDSDIWLGFVYPPGAVKAKGATVQATRKEGEEALLMRVRALIDADLD